MTVLPYISPLVVLLLALGYRCRGGFLPLPSTQLARVVYWALPIGVVVFPVSWLWAGPCAVLAFLGLLIPHSEFQSGASLKNTLGMAAVGLLRFALILAPLAVFNHLVEVFALLGLLSGPGYYAGWRWLNGKASPIHYTTSTGTVSNFATTGAEWSEVLTGASFGLGFMGVWCYEATISKVSWLLSLINSIL